MTEAELIRWDIVNFPKEEILKTGAKLEDVNIFTLVAIQRVRHKINSPIQILSLTTGMHRSPQHPEGTAIDFTTKARPEEVVKAMLGDFKGIGTYYNGTAYSYHGDLGPDIRRWSAIKRSSADKWIYIPFVYDPKDKYNEQWRPG